MDEAGDGRYEEQSAHDQEVEEEHQQVSRADIEASLNQIIEEVKLKRESDFKIVSEAKTIIMQQVMFFFHVLMILRYLSYPFCLFVLVSCILFLYFIVTKPRIFAISFSLF